MAEKYDVVVIGAGVAGLATGMYAGRLNMKTLVLGAMSSSEFPVGGVITITDTVENYPGFLKLTGQELAKNLENHARDYKTVSIKEERVNSIKRELVDGKEWFVLTTDNGEYIAPAVVFATGAKWRELPMKGADTFKNRGVHYCALCDGPLYRNKAIAVIGGSDSAAKESLFLAEHAAKVYIIYRGEQIRAEPVNMKLVLANEKIKVVNNTNVVEILGDQFVNKITLDKPFNGKSELEVAGVFGAIGHIPLSDLAAGLGVTLNDHKEIKINRASQTNVAGVFAAGDVVDSVFKQAITGVGEGVVAAYSAFEFLKKNEIALIRDK